MKMLKMILVAAIAATTAATAAQAHPPVHEPVEFMQFRYAGAIYSAVNTHTRGFLGGELIEIHDATGAVKASWWDNRSRCFTAHAFTNHPCWHPMRYAQLLSGKLRAQTASVVTRKFGGFTSEDTSTFCDHYSQLEYTVSGDTSGKCGHEDGLALPSWAE